ncbi:protease modulator HflK [Qipengyuania sediminis]|uniref:protease modulator HflK n=1 Tax=Qipengyuania sediminis TaxID=1532023 RepID=UPI001F0F1B5C|nr:protease modulator HflK [Qipengyuania sediminis]
MRLWDGFRQARSLAMAGKRNPWGKPEGTPETGNGGGEGDGGAPSGPDPVPDPPSSDKPSAPKGPRNPWLPPGTGPTRGEPPRRSASIEDIFKTRGPEGPRRAGKLGGGGPGGPSFSLPPRANGKSWWPLIVAGVVGLWLIVTSTHQVQPKQQALVTWLGGKYSHKLGPGLNFTLPWPLQQVTKENVSEIRSVKIGGEGEKLVLTGDQNLVDLSYVIRWNIKNLEQFTFQLDDPELTIREVAESAMRASLAEQELDQVVSGAGRAGIEARVVSRMQALLDAYKAGVAIQGIEIEKADPPAKVVDAFKDVSAAQQDANAMRNRARAYAQQVMARAQGDAAAFNQIYEEYRLAPEVTRRRLYYETMEAVLSKTDKTIVEADGVTPYLPLPEVQRRAQTPAAPQAERR